MSAFADKVFVINKESGPTSFEVVEAFRRATGMRKAGHTGTLDPLARGVLVLCTGRATRAVEHFMDLPKVYEFEVRLGVETTTLDAGGEVVREVPCPALDREQIEAAAASFIGAYECAPPAYSAVRKDGKRLYELAREGKDTSVAEREVQIYELDVLAVDLPHVTMRMKCSRGTYVRSFARDFAACFDLPAHVRTLIRVAVGPFHMDDAYRSEELFNKNVDDLHGLALSDAVTFLPGIVINQSSSRALLDGGLPGEQDVVQHIDVSPDGGPVRILDERGHLLAIGTRPAHAAGRRVAAVESFRLFVANGQS